MTPREPQKHVVTPLSVHGLYETQGTLSGLYLASILLPAGVNLCNPYSKLCTTSPTNNAPTAVHVSGTNEEPPFEYSYSVNENAVLKAPPIASGMNAHYELSVSRGAEAD